MWVERNERADRSRVAQWKRAGPITQRSVDRNHALLGKLFSHTLTHTHTHVPILTRNIIRITDNTITILSLHSSSSRWGVRMHIFHAFHPPTPTPIPNPTFYAFSSQLPPLDHLPQHLIIPIPSLFPTFPYTWSPSLLTQYSLSTTIIHLYPSLTNTQSYQPLLPTITNHLLNHHSTLSITQHILHPLLPSHQLTNTHTHAHTHTHTHMQSIPSSITHSLPPSLSLPHSLPVDKSPTMNSFNLHVNKHDQLLAGSLARHLVPWVCGFGSVDRSLTHSDWLVGQSDHVRMRQCVYYVSSNSMSMGIVGACSCC